MAPEEAWHLSWPRAAPAPPDQTAAGSHEGREIEISHSDRLGEIEISRVHGR